MSFRYVIVLTCALMLCALKANGQVMLQRAVIASGGTVATNGTQVAGMTAGQAVTGTATNGQTVGHFGFWTSAAAIAPLAVGTAPSVSVSMQAYPNPASDLATVNLQLAAAGPLDLGLYDMNGKEVRVISTGNHTAGNFEIALDFTGLASGSYVLAARLPGQLIEQSISVVH